MGDSSSDDAPPLTRSSSSLSRIKPRSEKRRSNIGDGVKDKDKDKDRDREIGRAHV